MDKLSIHLSNDETICTPGQSLQGSVQWRLETAPEHLKLSLFWYTSGKGTRDVDVVEIVTFDRPGTLGSKDFSFDLPLGPYSFSGRLISLIWALELTCSPDSETVRREIIVSPTGREIILDSASAGCSPWQGGGAIGGPLESILGRR